MVSIDLQQMRNRQDKRQIEYVQVSTLTPYARNSRTHTPQQVKQIAASIKEFGFTNPVLIDEANGIIAGHGRVMAAEHLQLDVVPCIRLDYMTEAQKRAYVIADNKLALNAGWNDELLKVELDDLHSRDYDLSLLGFDAGELESIMQIDADFAPASEEDQGKLDELAPKYATCPNCRTTFDTRGND
jgi:ParB-like chromosome segregation protein Spo0J